MVSKDGHSEFVACLLDLVHQGIVKRILVLLEPPSQVVVDSAGVVDDGEVGLRLAGLGSFGLDEARRLAKVVGVQLLSEGFVSGLREHGLFLQDGKETHFLK